MVLDREDGASNDTLVRSKLKPSNDSSCQAVKLSSCRVSREAGTQEHGIALDVHRTTELHLRPKDSVFLVKGNKME